MKAFLIDDIIKVDGAVLYTDISIYKEDGLYIVDNGSMCNLINFNAGIPTYLTMLPRNSVIEDYVEIEDKRTKQLSMIASSVAKFRSQVDDVARDQKEFKEELEDGLDRFSNHIELLINGSTTTTQKAIEALSQMGGSADIKLSDLTKMIAVAQKPDLIDKKVT